MYCQLLATLVALNVFFAPNLSAAAHRVIFNRIGPTRLALYLANADGSNERLLLPAEGLDYNASFSPDGRWIIFTSERAGSADIYRVHLDGTGLQRLTDDPAFDDQAALSPDGSKLAFVSTRNGGMARVWVMDLATRRCRILTNRSGGEFRPSWSPDGNWIAFTSDEGAHPGRIARSAELLQSGGFEFLQSTDLYIIRSDGTGLRRLTQPGGFAGSPKWSTDGKRIAFYQTTIPASFSSRSRRGPRENIEGQIVSVDVKTAERKEHTSGSGLKVSPQWLGKDRIGYVRKQGDDPGLEFTSGGKRVRGEFRNPSWSPDERSVVFHRELAAERPWMTPTFSADPDFELMLTEPFPAYAPKGDRVVVSARPEGPWPTYNFEEAGLEIMDADGKNRHRIFSQNGKNAYGASWSPAGNMIAFAVGSFFFRGTAPQLALIRPDGSDLHTITEGEASNGFPSWSPDGKRLVYRTDAKHGRGLVIRSLEDEKITPLTTGSQHDNFPAWSPRGDRILFVSNRDGNYNLYTIKPDGTDLQQLTKGSGNDSHPVWSPDGQWIVFSSSRMGFKDEAVLVYRIPQPYGELFVMRSDGSGMRQLTDNPWEDATPAWMPEPNKP